MQDNNKNFMWYLQQKQRQ